MNLLIVSYCLSRAPSSQIDRFILLAVVAIQGQMYIVYLNLFCEIEMQALFWSQSTADKFRIAETRNGHFCFGKGAELTIKDLRTYAALLQAGMSCLYANYSCRTVQGPIYIYIHIYIYIYI